MQATKLEGIRACVFDAYGTLFDVNSAAEAESEALGDQWKPLADIWRTKQLQYTWLRSLMCRYADFEQITAEALDVAMAETGLDDSVLRQRLIDLYQRLDAYPEVQSTMEQLKQRGLQLAILSNGTPGMLAAACENAGIAHLLNAVLSVEAIQTFKPDPAVYQLALDHFGLAPREICFLSSNSWDAYAAKAFGFRVLWCNRFGQPPERIPETPDGEIKDLRDLLEWL